MTESCALCGESFAGAADLVIHRRDRHADANSTSSLATNPEAYRPGLVCTLCARRFPTPEALAAHSLRPHVPRRRRSFSGPAPG